VECSNEGYPVDDSVPLRSISQTQAVERAAQTVHALAFSAANRTLVAVGAQVPEKNEQVCREAWPLVGL